MNAWVGRQAYKIISRLKIYPALSLAKKTRRVCYARLVSLLTTTFQPASCVIPADCGFTLLDEGLVDGHDHARVDFLDNTVRQSAGIFIRAVALGNEIKHRNRQGTTFVALTRTETISRITGA
jgi:hypothetical protein